MTAFIDSSALLALLDASDDSHVLAVTAWQSLSAQSARLITTNYVLVEATAVAQCRLGIDAVRALVREVIPLLDVVFVDETTHAAAVAALLVTGRRHLSLVDCASFEVMRRESVATAFAYDQHFSDQGFSAV